MIVVRVNSTRNGVGPSDSGKYRVRVESFEDGMNYLQGDYNYEDYRINGSIISFYDKEFEQQEASMVVNFNLLKLSRK